MAPTDSSDTGFWGQPTSSIDWCEINYEVSPYVAEMWNTVSSLSYICAGTHGILVLRRRHLERRFTVCYLILILIGVGSTLFHATLKYEMQLADEVPMLVGIPTLLFVMVQIDPPKIESRRSKQLIIVSYFVSVLFLLGIHLFTTYWIIFLVMNIMIYLTMIAVGVALLVKVPNTWSLVKMGTSLILAGGFSWIADAYFCDQLTAFKTYDNIFARILGPFIQGHALWHVFSAAASYCQVKLTITAARELSRKRHEGAGNGRKKVH